MPRFVGSHDTAVYKFLCCFFIIFKALASHFQPLNSMFHCFGMLFYEILKKITNESEILAAGFQKFTNP